MHSRPMKKDVLQKVFFVLSLIFITLILIDGYLIEPSIELDVFKNLHINNRSTLSHQKQWDYLTTEAGEEVRIPDRAGIYFEY